MATRRYGTIVRHLKEDPDTAAELAAKLPDEQLIELAAALRDDPAAARAALSRLGGSGGGGGGGDEAEHAESTATLRRLALLLPAVQQAREAASSDAHAASLREVWEQPPLQNPRHAKHNIVFFNATSEQQPASAAGCAAGRAAGFVKSVRKTSRKQQKTPCENGMREHKFKM